LSVFFGLGLVAALEVSVEVSLFSVFSDFSDLSVFLSDFLVLLFFSLGLVALSDAGLLVVVAELLVGGLVVAEVVVDLVDGVGVETGITVGDGFVVAGVPVAETDALAEAAGVIVAPTEGVPVAAGVALAFVEALTPVVVPVVVVPVVVVPEVEVTPTLKLGVTP
jgi:hypothetical protein